MVTLNFLRLIFRNGLEPENQSEWRGLARGPTFGYVLRRLHNIWIKDPFFAGRIRHEGFFNQGKIHVVDKSDVDIDTIERLPHP